VVSDDSETPKYFGVLQQPVEKAFQGIRVKPETFKLCRHALESHRVTTVEMKLA